MAHGITQYDAPVQWKRSPLMNIFDRLAGLIGPKPTIMTPRLNIEYICRYCDELLSITQMTEEWVYGVCPQCGQPSTVHKDGFFAHVNDEPAIVSTRPMVPIARRSESWCDRCNHYPLNPLPSKVWAFGCCPTCSRPLELKHHDQPALTTSGSVREIQRPKWHYVSPDTRYIENAPFDDSLVAQAEPLEGADGDAHQAATAEPHGKAAIDWSSATGGLPASLEEKI